MSRSQRGLDGPSRRQRVVARSPWTVREAAHLARRAGFGARPDEIERLVAIGREQAIASFVDFPERDEKLLERERRSGGSLAKPDAGAVFDAVESIREWWLNRMVHGSFPLQEKLALLWHDHFACQFSKLLRAPLYFEQNETFRRLAAAPFGELLRAVAADPGMLVFLDNRVNVAANPNENWSRELLELFTLGVDRYTQQDVVEGARIFTGWSTPDPNKAEFVFREDTHDPGDKEYLGARIAGRSGAAGIEEGREALERILARDDCARFIAGKLWGWFVTHEPNPRRIEEIARVLRANDLSVREALRAIFRADWFYDPPIVHARFKNPVEWIVSAARLLAVQNSHLLELRQAVRAMGMDLFEPPSVAGWDHGEAWINSGTVVARLNLALRFSELPNSRREVVGTAVLDLEEIAGTSTIPAVIAQRVADRLLQHPLESSDLAALVEALDAIHEADGDERALRRARTRAAVHLILASPAFALC